MKKLLSIAFLTACSCAAFSQNIAINESGAQPDTSAMLDISSTTKGLLIPRMTKAEKNAIPLPGSGLLVYQTAPDSVGFHYFDGANWLWLATNSSKEAWITTGNSGTDTAVNFLGTTDDKAIMLRQHNLPIGQLNSKTHNYFIGGGAGVANTASNNTGYGDSTLARNTSGTGNTAVGHRALVGAVAVTGDRNVAVGSNSLSALSTGFQNIAVGDSAMANMQTGFNNVTAGSGAMEYASKGESNVALGTWALRNNDSASYNIAIGTAALFSNVQSRNIGIGHTALYYSNRSFNTAIGYAAGYLNNYLQTSNDQGIENTYVGYGTGYGANTASKNVAIGHRALAGTIYFNGDDPSNGYYKRNVAIGDSAMFSAYGSDNVAIGFKAIFNGLTTGRHVAIGSRALYNTVAGYPNTAIGYSSQDSNSTGAANTSLGSYSLVNNTTGYNNTAIGNAAMFGATNAINPAYMYDNTAIGNDALRLIRYSGETAVGAGALRNDTGSSYNTAIGYLSMYYHLRGNSNTALGTSALRFDTTGWQNTSLGVNTMFNHKSGDNNVAVGMAALYNDTSGYGNVAVGAFALNDHLTNSFNTAIGTESMNYDKGGLYNSAVGWRSLRYARNADQNTAVGVGAIEFTDSARYNVAMGRGAMMGKGGRHNTSIGFYASGANNGPSSSNYYVTETTSLGAFAGFRNFGNYNTFLGSNAGYGAGVDSLSGIENTAVGAYSLFYNSTGQSNTVVGIGSMYSNATGNGNVAVGTRALGYSNGSYNIAIGDSAMFNNNANANMAIGTNSMRFNGTGANNSAAGNFSMQNNSTGSYNAALGDSSLFANNTGSGNTATGHNALPANTNGQNNTAIGYNALSANTSGSTNTALGYYANTSASNLSNATAIGANALVAQSNSIVLGSINGVNNATASVKVGIGTNTPDSSFSVANKLSIGSSGTIQFDNTVPVMNYMFKSGSSNSNRMLFAHSPAFSTWGLQYQDAGDKFHFLGSGSAALTVDLTFLRVGVGVTSPTHQFQLSTDDAAKLSTSTWSITSDIRLKKVDGNYTRGLQDILKLNTIRYHYAPGNARNLATDVEAYGFSAQEVQAVFPEAVTLEKDGYLSLNIHPILIAYVNAFKEQQQQIKTLQQELATARTNDQQLLQKLLERIENLETKLAASR